MQAEMIQNNRRHPWQYMALFPLVVLYYEIVFRLSTTGGLFRVDLIYLLLFSVAYGGIGYLLSTATKSDKFNRIVTGTLIVLSAAPYIVEFFIYRQFKQFYDVAMIFGSAGDAVGDYYGEMFDLIFCFDGIFHIILFAVPITLFLVFKKRYLQTLRATLVTRCVAAGAMVVLYLLSVLLVMVNDVHSLTYTNQYNFQGAVETFGLYSGLQLDMESVIFGDSDDAFETPGSMVVPTVPGADKPSDESIEYGYNQMNLNLSGGSDRIKDLNEYVSLQTASRKNKYTGMFKGKNLIFISAEAFTGAVISPELTPTLYRLATKGINFTDYYQPDSAGTTGGEYQNIFGMLPTSGGSSFKETADNLNYFTMGSQLDRLGYYGKAYHNNTYTYYDRDKTHVNLGYSDGFMGYGNGMEQYVRKTWPQSDLEMVAGTLPTYIDKQPFNVYYMSVSGHSNYDRSGNMMTSRHWDKVKDLPYSDPVKGYIAANLEFEAALTHLVDELEKKGIADDTVICISADHFPYGLDDDGSLGDLPYLSELFGQEVNNYFQRDRNRLILWCGSLEKEQPIVVDTPTFSLDILPTLSNLFGTEFDSRLFPGRDVFSDAPALVYNTNYDWKTEHGTYFASSGKFVPNDPSVSLPDDYIDTVKTIVRNKIRYCKWTLENDYYRALFG
ncbi:MAG: LTA synthase family protein [Clostridia bacterium]|nr:LTA synthase family protein [Clostridia bacterium]